MRSATFNIAGMHCASCSARNERTLKKLAGVREATVNLATRLARVEFDEATVSESALHKAVTANGYQVLKAEYAGAQKEEAKKELQGTKRRAFIAVAFTIPVVALAMLPIALPGTCVATARLWCALAAGLSSNSLRYARSCSAVADSI